AVPDTAHCRCRANRLDHLAGIGIGDHNVDPELGYEIHNILRATIDFGMALLASKALDRGNGHALYAQAAQRLAHFLELEWLDDGDHELHRHTLPICAVCGSHRTAQSLSSTAPQREGGARPIQCLRVCGCAVDFHQGFAPDASKLTGAKRLQSDGGWPGI